jgi:D-arabinose 1-dehydrogenase-like Zn-dependent alcohol dehydrogenase
VLYCGVCHSDIHSVNHGASRSRWCRAMKLSAA